MDTTKKKGCKRESQLCEPDTEESVLTSKKKKTGSKKKSDFLTDHITDLEKYNAEIKATLKKYHLQQLDSYNPKLSKYIGSEYVRREYWNILIDFAVFLNMIGRYDDLLLFHDKEIKNAPSIHPNCLIMYSNYKYKPAGTELIDLFTGKELLN